MLPRTAVLLAIACAACATTGPLEPPKITVTDVTIDRFTAADARFTVQVKLSNPNTRELAVDRLDAELRLEAIPVGAAALTTPVRVPPLGDATASVAAAMDLISSLRASAEIARRLREEKLASPVVRYAVTGRVVLQGGSTVLFTRAGEFKLALTAPAR